MNDSPKTGDQCGIWQRHSSQWNKLGSPQRPSPEDGAIMMAAAGADLARPAATDVLVLGVTPEVVQLPWPASLRLHAFDHSAEMIATVWQPHPQIVSSARQASWQSLPLADRSVCVAVGDGSFNSLPELADYTDVLRELARVLQPDALLCLRYYALPLVRESLAEVEAAVRAGQVQGDDQGVEVVHDLFIIVMLTHRFPPPL